MTWLVGQLQFVLAVRVQHQVADAILGRGVDDGAQQREAAPLAGDAVLARGEGDVAAGAVIT
jgi:hypothetical protein